ncbi:MAG: hypothetical protein IPL61_37625 [Myxococcales bacterium]|nr:hypothetical protein [Myxococcales bacterium]
MRRTAALAAATLSLLVAGTAAAHVRIMSPTPRSSVDLKARHCGVTGSPRANVQTYRPGAVLHLVWNEYVPHPGWLRISFNANSDTFRIPPGVAAGTPAGYPTENLTGMMDPGGSGSLIIEDRIPNGSATTRDITLPMTECTNCTLQLIQMMTDKPPYTIDELSNDIYFACVDLVISATDPLVDAGPGDPDGGANPGDPDGGTAPAELTSGCGCQGSGGAPAGLALVVGVGLMLPRRRRRA